MEQTNPLPIEGTIVVTNGEPTKIEMQNIPIVMANTEFTIDLLTIPKIPDKR